MEGKGFNVKKLIQTSNVSDKTILNALKGLPITRKSAEKISKALEVKMSHICSQHGEPGKLSSQTVLHHHRLISSILQDAMEWQVIYSNAAERVKAPGTDKRIPQHYNKDQVKSLINALASEHIKYRTMVILDAFTGLRTGELMGLTWSDIDLENGTIDVNKVSQYLSDRGTFTKDRPKNYHSIRSISIPPFVIALLKLYKVFWNEQKLSRGDLWQKSNHLFVTWDGRPLFTYILKWASPTTQ